MAMWLTFRLVLSFYSILNPGESLLAANSNLSLEPKSVSHRMAADILRSKDLV